jgi:hypothetical protein
MFWCYMTTVFLLIFLAWYIDLVQCWYLNSFILWMKRKKHWC